MHILLLPGQGKHNQEWLEQMSSTLGDCATFSWEHWETGGMIDVDQECEKVIANFLDEDVIVAKSAGALVALKAMYEQHIIPKACVFLGTPINFAHEHKIPLSTWLRELPVPTLFIQQTDDSAGNFRQLKAMLEAAGTINYEMVEIAGEDHQYDNAEELKKHIDAFLGTE